MNLSDPVSFKQTTDLSPKMRIDGGVWGNDITAMSRAGSPKLYDQSI